VDWTPDGTGILFASDRRGTWDLWLIVLTEGRPVGSAKLLKRDIGSLDRGLGFTRAGFYYYSILAWENDVYGAALDARTGKLHDPNKLVRHVGFDTSLQWSPDGKQLAYAYRDPDALAVRSVETDKEHRLRPKIGFFHLFQPHWSPDGRFLLGQGRHTGYLGPGIGQGLYLVDAQTGESRAILNVTDTQCPPECVEWPAWSADGKVIFARWIKWPQKIVVRDVQSGAEKELYRATSPAFVSHLAVSPDGQQVAFLWYDRPAGDASIRVVPIAGGDARELVKLPPLADYWLPLFALDWDSDSRHLIYAPSSAEPGRKLEFWRTSLDGGEPQNLDLSLDGVLPFGLSVHPDGRRIAFAAGTPLRTEVWVLENFLPPLKAPK
jgi:Tol biopolymer transport system component